MDRTRGCRQTGLRAIADLGTGQLAGFSRPASRLPDCMTPFVPCTGQNNGFWRSLSAPNTVSIREGSSPRGVAEVPRSLFEEVPHGAAGTNLQVEEQQRARRPSMGVSLPTR